MQEILLSDSSETSDDDDDPITEDDFKQMLQLHKEQKLSRRKYLLEKNVRYYYINTKFWKNINEPPNCLRQLGVLGSCIICLII